MQSVLTFIIPTSLVIFCFQFTQGVSLADTHLSATFEGQLTSSQYRRMFSDVGGYTRSDEDKVKKQKYYEMAKEVVQQSQRMVPKGTVQYMHGQWNNLITL